MALRGGLAAATGEVAVVSGGSTGGLAVLLPQRRLPSSSDHLPSCSDTSQLLRPSPHLLPLPPQLLQPPPSRSSTSEEMLPGEQPWCLLLELSRSGQLQAVGGCGFQHGDLGDEMLDHLLGPSSFTESWD